MSSLVPSGAVRALLVTRCISCIILWMDFTLVFSIMAFDRGSATTTIGLAAALYGVPGLFLGPWIGALADRVSPIGALAVSYLLRAGASVGIIFSASPAAMLVMVFLQGMSNLGAMPAEQILVKRLLRRDQMILNIQLVTVIDQSAKIGAPIVGGLIAQSLGPSVGFWISAGLVVPALGCLRLLRGIAPDGGRRHGSSPRHGAGGGQIVRLLRTDGMYRLAFAAMLTQTAVLALYDPLLALFLKGLGCGPAVFGQIVSATALGGIGGAMAFQLVSNRVGRRMALFSLTGFGVSVFVPGILAWLGIRVPVASLLGLWVLNGLCYGVTAMHFGVTQQLRCPAETIGAVASTARSAQLAALVAGPVLGASLATVLGVAGVLTLAGAAAVAFALGASWVRGTHAA
ncbi:MAG: MFS transporter [Gallionella sp.]|nr:MFS transporter [Gallionella sp.]